MILYKHNTPASQKNKSGTSINRGFTLIELLVVFSIIAVLAGLGIASFAAYSRSQQVNQAANNIKLLVSEARFNSLSAVKNITDDSGNQVSCGNETLNGYSITVIGNNQLEFDLECTNLNATRVKLINMPNGLTFTAASTCTTIGFATLSSTASGIPCKFVLVGNGYTKTISIDVIGNVSIQ